MTVFLAPVFVGCFVSFLFHRRHLLFSLLSLEAMMLAMVISGSTSCSMMACNFTLIVILVFAVAEASLGLSVLVYMSRSDDSTLVGS